jgi:hypothetical protein
MVVATSSHGAVTLKNDEGTLFKVNGQHLKIFLESDKSPKELDASNSLFFLKYYISATSDTFCTPRDSF